MKSHFSAVLLIAVFLCAASAAAATTIKLFILAGQSNSVGIAHTADLPSELQQPQTNVKFYPMGQTTGKHYVGWTTLQPGLWCDDNECSEVGSYITFGRDLARAMPNDSLAIFLLGTGAVTMGEQWRSPSNGGAGSLYTDLMNGLTEAISDLGSGYEVEISGMLWMQGESDAMDPNIAGSYETYLHNFINDVRNDLNVPFMPFVIGMIDSIPGWYLAHIVRPKQMIASRQNVNVGIVDTYGFPKNGDGGHYNAMGQMILGCSFAAIMQRLLANPVPGAFVEPSDLVARARDDGTVKLFWRDNSNGETGYKIERSSGDGIYGEIAAVDAGTGVMDSFVDNSVEASTLYSYKVTALGASGSSAYSNVAAVFPRGAGDGLTAAYFSDVDLNNLVLERVDTTINFIWNGDSPGAGLSSVFSARWTGFIQPRYTDEYTFFVASDMVGRVWINDHLVVDQWQYDYVPDQIYWPVHAGMIHLEAGRSYPIKVEYYVTSSQIGRSHAILKWQSINYYQEMQVVPKNLLYRNAPPAVFNNGQILSKTNLPNNARFSVSRLGSDLRVRGLSGTANAAAIVTDIRGRTIAKVSAGRNSIANLGDFSAGIRIVTLRGRDGIPIREAAFSQ